VDFIFFKGVSMTFKNFLMVLVLFSLSSMTLAAPVQRLMNEKATKYESVVLNFDQGSSKLNDAELLKLKTAISNAKLYGKISKVDVAVWSDKDHPMSGNLPESDQKLAKERIKSVKEGLRDETSIFERITSYNMTDNAHWLGRRLHTNEAELDAVFAKNEKGALERKDFEIIKKDGGPSKAVVILNIKEK
jgi:hypothetical protein